MLQKNRLGVVCIILIMFSFLTAAFAGQPEQKGKGKFALDRIIVKFKSHVTPDDIVHDRRPGIKKLKEKFSVKEVKQMFPKSGKNDKLDDLKETHGLTRIHLLKVPQGTDIEQMVLEYSQDPDVEYAEPDYEVEAALTPNDTYYSSNQWDLNNTGQTGGTADADIDAPEAWNITTGNSSVIIAVVDTGVQLNHPDLSGKILSGYDFVNSDSDPSDDNGHGTLVAGIAAANSNNSTGVAGVCWNCSIMPVKVMAANGSGSFSNVANGTIYAADHGAHVINLSLAGSSSSLMSDAVLYAYNAGVVVVAGMGNDGGEYVKYPAGVKEAISVGATDHNDARASYSNYAYNIDVAAPGDNITSTYTGSSFGTASGTSLATPHVAGLAGLIRSQHPTYTPDQVKWHIENGADDKGTAGWDKYYGWGRINAYNSLQSISPGLTFSTESVFADSYDKGVTPSSGTAFVTTITYKTIYFDDNNSAPSYVQVCIDGTCQNMSVNGSASSSLRDGNYTNGEQYVYTTTLSAGSHDYYFITSNGSGTKRIPASGTMTGPTVTADTTPPTGTISINSGATSTNSTSVTLTLSCTDTSGCSQMQFSNDNATWSSAETYTTSKAWTLTTGDGTKTVYAQFKDTAGNWSSTTISDTIILDTAPPTGTITINSGAASTNSTSVTLTLSCSDTNGCAQMQFSNDNSAWSTAEGYATSKTWTLSSGDGTKTVYVKFKDTAGNWSTATISETINIVAVVNTGDVTIVTSGSSSGGSWDGNTWMPSATGSTVLASEIVSHLALGATVIYTSVSGDIIVNGAVSWSANNTLTLASMRDIKVNANISATGDTAGLVLGYGTGRSYTLTKGTSITLSGATPILQIGVSGSEATYTIIKNATALQGMSANLAGKYALGSNITAAAFSSIGTFTGTFDGLGHTVANLTIGGVGFSNVGLFGSTGTGSVMRNVGIVGGSMTGSSSIGGLVGSNSGTIINCYATGYVRGASGVGGLVGGNSGTISNSYAEGSVAYQGTNNGINVGGLAGVNSGTISNSYATGSVSIYAGYTNSGNSVGGLAGLNSGTISNSYATGSVSGTSNIGGLVGYNDTGATVTSSYSTGSVSGTSNIGGLLGYNNTGAAVTNSFWDTVTSGQPTVGAGVNVGTITNVVGMNTTNMMIQANFTPSGVGGTNWDFTNIWHMFEGITRPVLRNLTTPMILSSSSISFVSQNVGAVSAAQIVTLANTGTLMVNISSIVASGDYAQTTSCGATLAVGENCTISVTFTPTAAGIRTGAVTITSDAPSSPNIVSLSGSGVVLAPVASLSTSMLTFSNQNVSSTSAALTVTLSNTGNATLNISSIVASGDYARTTTCGATLAAGANCTISVTFTPTAAGARTGAVTITSDAASSPNTVSLSGTGVALAPVASLSTSTLTFSNQNVGSTSVAQTVTLSNTGNATLNISSIAASGDYARTTTCGATLAASASCTISVTFTPTTAGARTGAVTITTNAVDSPHSVSLSGTGIVTSDTTPPTGSITINSGAASTGSASVTLTLSATDNSGTVSQMQFSNDNTTWSTAEAYVTSKAWTLTTGDGTKTVYVKFKDTAGNWSTAYNDTITLITPDAPPSKPANIDVAQNGIKGELVVSWSNPSDADFNHIHIYRSTASGTLGTLIADNVTGIKYTDTGLASLTTYYYTVRAVDNAGNESTNTNATANEYGYYPKATTLDATPPAVPTGVTATDATTGGKINLTWTNPADSDFSMIKVYRSTASGRLGSSVFIGLATSYSDTGLTNGVTYYYTVRTIDTSSNETTNTTQVSATPTAPDTTPAGTPGSITVTDTTAGGALTVSWTNPVDADFAYIRIYRSTTSGQLGSPVYDNVTGTSKTDTGLTNNATYYYTIRSVDTAGNESTNTNQVSGMPTDIQAPASVLGLTATLLSSDQIKLDWTRSVSSDINAYNIYSDNGTGTIDYTYANKVGTVQHPTTIWTSGSLTVGTRYKFAVRAEDAAQNEEANTNVVVSIAPVSNSADGSERAYVSTPKTGRKIGGSRITVVADLLTGTAADVASVTFEYKPASSGSWTAITPSDASFSNPDTTRPWFIHWDVTGLSNGDYLLRAVANNGSADPNPEYVTVTVDNGTSELSESPNGGLSEKSEKVSANTDNRVSIGDLSGLTTLTVPTGALDSDTKVTVTVSDTATKNTLVPSGYGKGNEFREVILDSGQTSLSNNKTAEIVIPYRDDDNDGIVDGTTTKVYDLKVMRYNTSTSSWDKLDSVVDTTNKTVKGKTSHFTLFGLLAPPNPTTPGWNIVAVPLQPSPNSASTVFGQTPYVYNPTTNGYDRPSTIQPGVGYWIKGGANLTATGTETPTTGNFSINIKKGWNMIGNPFRFNVKLSDMSVLYNSTTYTMAEAETNGYLIGTVYPYVNGVYQFINASDGGAMEPWVGYWILSDKDCTLLVPPMPAQ